MHRSILAHPPNEWGRWLKKLEILVAKDKAP